MVRVFVGSYFIFGWIKSHKKPISTEMRFSLIFSLLLHKYKLSAVFFLLFFFSRKSIFVETHKIILQCIILLFFSFWLLIFMNITLKCVLCVTAHWSRNKQAGRPKKKLHRQVVTNNKKEVKEKQTKMHVCMWVGVPVQKTGKSNKQCALEKRLNHYFMCNTHFIKGGEREMKTITSAEASTTKNVELKASSRKYT